MCGCVCVTMCLHVYPSKMQRQRAVLYLNGKRTGWLCRTLRIKRNFLHVLSLPSPGSIFLGHFHDIVFERGPHEDIQDGVEAAVEECDALRNLDGNVHALAHVAVSDQQIDGIYGLAELDNVIGQLGDNENNNYCEQNPEGSRLFNVGHLDERPGSNGIAHAHDEKGNHEADADFQHLNGCFQGCSQVVGKDRSAPSILIHCVKN